jgi:hypothetical protein
MSGREIVARLAGSVPVAGLGFLAGVVVGKIFCPG